jgi:hypothetical protein
VALAVFFGMMWATVRYVQDKGEYIREGTTGNPVQVTMAGDRVPLSHNARLLGSSGAFVFLWWPQARIAEAVPIESIAKLQSLPLRATKAAPATTLPGTTAATPAAN